LTVAAATANLAAMRRRLFAHAILPLLPLLPAALLMQPTPAPAADLPPDAGDSWFIFLETGRPTPDDPPAVQAMQRGHLENFKRLFAAGRLQAAGPLADPARIKRGIVVVRAASLDELDAYFQPDDYVREGYLRLNAQRATPRRPLHTEGIDASRIEEVRLLQISRPTTAAGAGAALASDADARRRQLLQGLVDAGTLGAWYSLADGPVAEVLLARGTDSAALEAALAPYPGLADGSVSLVVWRQWISPGVVGPR
jgi:uncharacterized protein YciI